MISEGGCTRDPGLPNEGEDLHAATEVEGGEDVLLTHLCGGILTQFQQLIDALMSTL